MIKRVLGVLVMLLASLALAGVVSPASGAPIPTIVVCNDAASVDSIIAYNNSAGYITYIAPGLCRNGVNDYLGNARVDVDVGGSGGDVDSWKKANISSGGGYGPCYNNEDESSNPYSSPPNATTLYKTYSHTGC